MFGRPPNEPNGSPLNTECGASLNWIAISVTRFGRRLPLRM